MTSVTLLGALLALGIAIVLIIKGIPASYSMLFGALVGGVVGGAGLAGTLDIMVTGASGMTSAILRIVAAGILAGVLMGSGAANTIAETIVNKLGEKNSLVALTISTFYSNRNWCIWRCISFDCSSNRYSSWKEN